MHIQNKQSTFASQYRLAQLTIRQAHHPSKLPSGNTYRQAPHVTGHHEKFNYCLAVQSWPPSATPVPKVVGFAHF